MRVMEDLPDWENDPIDVICAPISGLLMTRAPFTLYGLDWIDFKPGKQFKQSAEQRLRKNASVRKHRMKKRAS